MNFTSNEIATYLFNAQLSQTKTTPLTILEWNAVVKSFAEHEMQPDVLLSMTSSELHTSLTQATNKQKSSIIKKVEARQKLGISMLELEDIFHQGYKVMFRSHMPPRIKKITQKYLPAFFSYVGDPIILTHRAFGIVGSRDANQEELAQTISISREAVTHGVVIISGGAKGIDSTAVEAALQAGGKAIVFPAEGLAKWVKKSSIREYINSGQLLLMSTQKPDAPFTPSYAMQRNNFIHGLSDGVLVASSQISGTKSSGTWEGVQTNLKVKWSPIFVIGQSEGVERLIKEKNAIVFSSFKDIYEIGKTAEKDRTNVFDVKAIDLIKLAIKEGRTKETIKKDFEKVLNQLFNNEKFNNENQNSQKNLKVDKEKLKVKQLSVDDIDNEKE